ncbi:hypothetical protein [Edaphosphingomonas haloaromaticamans]|uniref:Uncharacterized protein n=1 Tax=Edaphosphingomonas haloaromaticamans TaxID=653954 RepID=A0A1S1HCL8_9SPHN|nr:hypothetical protein [Sphingomonas haloaromaticamans]OHT19944.1 hypothetical protein BHE75_01937 [Sphingomonas haloaromaticamans]
MVIEYLDGIRSSRELSIAKTKIEEAAAFPCSPAATGPAVDPQHRLGSKED